MKPKFDLKQAGCVCGQGVVSNWDAMCGYLPTWRFKMSWIVPRGWIANVMKFFDDEESARNYFNGGHYGE